MLVNGRAARASHRLRAGDRVRVELPPPRRVSIEPEAEPLAIVHQDEDLVVVDKPAGLAVHPGAGRHRGTLVHALLHHYPEIASVGGAGRPGIVHRLDKDTSGLLLVARTPRAYLAMVEAIAERRVTRTYAALVWGAPPGPRGTIEAPIGRDPRNRKRMAVARRGGKPARTRWRQVERLGPASLLEVRLDTGRTHQIRVHLADLGHPVVGDPLYGGRGKKGLSLAGAQRSLALELLKDLERQALHASGLSLPHPVSGEALEFSSAWPQDIARAIERLRAACAGRPKSSP